MTYYYEIAKAQSLAHAQTSGRAAEVLPTHFSLMEEEEKLLLVVEVVEALSDDEIFQRVQRECDRIAFLTGEDLVPCFIRKDNSDGSSTAVSQRNARTAGWTEIPTDVARQQWEDVQLHVQLRLWHLAGLPGLPMNVQIVLLFQIIEIEYSARGNCTDMHYPEYTDRKRNPDPRTEAKLFRDLASHGKTEMNNPQIREYCKRHEILPVSNDPTDRNLTWLFNDRISVVNAEARKIIDAAITRM